MKVTNKPILLVEDDDVDTMTVTRALKEIHVTNQLVHRENGQDALNYLEDETNDKPCIILLDLNMPIMNGIEFLQAVKNDDRFKRIPVVVLTTSDEQQDKLNTSKRKSLEIAILGCVAPILSSKSSFWIEDLVSSFFLKNGCIIYPLT